MERGANFKLIHENQKNSIICEIDTGRKKQQLENRKKIIPIIRTVLLCGRQGLSLRGHRDHGSLSLDLPIENDGNFRALLRFAIDSGDISLRNHIENIGRNSLYISPQIQNEIAHIAGGVIQRKIFFQYICEALEELDDSNVRYDSTKPHALLAAIRTPQFIIALEVMKPAFSLSKNIIQYLQEEL